uniref:Uncharacterized protein n=1 Tax=Ignavibacterium album TaxID=591197 RepID=A0A7V3E6U4_9BACT
MYYQLAKPKKINFWYAPFVSDENGNNTANDFTLYWFQRNLQQAHLQQNDFFVTLQTFGWRDKQTNLFSGYRTPTPEEISAETMLARAHGIKGLFYEHYYSIRNMEFGGRYYIIDGLVDTLQNGGFPLTPRWNKVEAIFNRLKGVLGKTLMNLNYNSSYLQLRRYIHEPTTQSVTKYYLTLSEVSLEGFPKIDFHSGFLEDKNNNDNKFFLLTNQITVGSRLVELSLIKPVTGFYNYRFRNVEPQYNFDTTYQNTFTTTLNFPAGEGYLYQVAPVVKYGGKLAYNDTIKSNTTLFEDMTIKNNVKLIIDRGKYYTITDTVTLEGTGFITGAGYLNAEQNGAVNINQWTQSIFKGRQINNPKIIWGRYPTSGMVTKYRIFRAIGNNQFIQIAEVDSTKRQFIDSTTII